MFVLPVVSPFRLRVSQYLDRAAFPAPATSNAACGFPALRSPVCFTSRVMGLIVLGRRHGPPNLVAVEQPQRFVQPLRTPPLPAEALSIPGPRHVAPDLLFHPVFNEAEALAGISHRKVGHPTAKHWIDQLNDPIQGLRLVAAEYILELPQQRRSFLELGCVLRTPHATTTANASEVEASRLDRGLRFDSSLH